MPWAHWAHSVDMTVRKLPSGGALKKRPLTMPWGNFLGLNGHAIFFYFCCILFLFEYFLMIYPLHHFLPQPPYCKIISTTVQMCLPCRIHDNGARYVGMAHCLSIPRQGPGRMRPVRAWTPCSAEAGFGVPKIPIHMSQVLHAALIVATIGTEFTCTQYSTGGINHDPFQGH